MTGAITAAFRRHPRDRAIAALAVPALGTLAIDPLVSIVDTAWVGRLGTEPLAALAVASAIFLAAFSIFNFVHSSVTPLVAGEVGRNDLGAAGAVAVAALAVAAGVGAVVGIIGILLAPQLTDLFGAVSGVADSATVYLRIRFLSMPAMLVAMAGHGVFRGHSDTRTPLAVAIGMNVVNLVLDPVLIFGFDLGVAGAAWATLTAQCLAAGWFLTMILGTRRRSLGIDRRSGSVTGLHVGRVVAAGWPLMVRSGALLFAITATTFAATRLGTAQVAAHQIAMQVWLFLSFALDSFAIAAMSMIGTDLGAERHREARSVADRLLALGFVAGLGLSLLLWATAPFVASIFSTDPQVRDLVASIYPFVVALQPLTALVYVWDGIGIGASAFRFLAGSMVVAAVVTVIVLVLAGSTLVGVWLGVLALTVSRLGALGGWYRFGPLGSA